MPPGKLAGLGRVFAFGAVVGSFFDGFHTYGGMTAYPHPVVLRMAWWTMPLFGGAFSTLALAYAAGRRRTEQPPEGARLAVGFLAFAALYFATGFLPTGHVAKLGLLLAGFVALAWLVDRTRGAFVAALIAAVVGPATEIVLVRLGLFTHLEPDALGLPLWLPALYLASGPGLGPLVYRLLRGRGDDAKG